MISEKNGYVQELNAEKVGRMCIELGAGRHQKEDEIDRRVGIILCKKIGDSVEVGETLGFIHANSSEKIDEHIEQLKQAYKIIAIPVEKEAVVEEIL